MNQTIQLPLGISLRDDATFDNFYAGNNRVLVDALRALIAGGDEHFIYCWGEEGSGKSHLLQACCHHMNQRGKSSVYFSLNTSELLSPDLLEGLEFLALVCIDDIEVIAGKANWEEALFHFYNRARGENIRLLVASTALSNQLPFKLADLQSRLAWGVTFQVHALSDDQKLEALQRRSKARGLELGKEVGEFLLRHYSRDTESLFNLLDKLDVESLAAQRKLTIPFVKTIIALG